MAIAISTPTSPRRPGILLLAWIGIHLERVMDLPREQRWLFGERGRQKR
jgi:hypothetical protein